MVFKIALRNILAKKIKTIAIGSVIVVGSFVTVLGSAFLDSISSGMRKSVTESIAGDIQIYSSEAKDAFSIIGSDEGNFPDISQINNFAEIKKTLMDEVPNIKEIVPQGTNYAFQFGSNILDIKLAELRKTNISDLNYKNLKEHIKQICENILVNYKKTIDGILKIDKKDYDDNIKNLNIAASDNFWNNFDKDKNTNLEFLENKIAPLIYDEAWIYFFYIGTAIDLFENSFPNFEIIKGTSIPQGKRGFLINDYFNENMLKHKVALRFDKIRDRIKKNKAKISDDKEIKDRIKENIAQAPDIYNQISPTELKALIVVMQKFLNTKEADTAKLFEDFLTVDDKNFFDRYDFFYEHIAPKIILYKTQIGDYFTISSITKSGYQKSLNLKVYGVFKFKNLEDSPLSGFYNVMDLISFRDLYGYLTPEKKAETLELSQIMKDEFGFTDDFNPDDAFKKSDIKNSIIVKDVKKESLALTNNKIFIQKQKLDDIVYTKEDMENGVCLNAAIILKNSDKLNTTLIQIKKVIEKYNLSIKAIDWKEASGLLGKLTIVIQIILYIFIGIIFIIAIFIIMNATLMSAMERTTEIGTMRAIGAKRSFIIKLILAETTIITVCFSIIGIILASILIFYLGKVGIDSPHEHFNFVFSGPKLYLHLKLYYIFYVFLITGITCILSSLYPSIKAIKIQPIVAIRKGNL